MTQNKDLNSEQEEVSRGQKKFKRQSAGELVANCNTYAKWMSYAKPQSRNKILGGRGREDVDFDVDPQFSDLDLKKDDEIRESKFPRVDSKQEEILKFWRPWRRSLLIKVLGRRVGFKVLKNWLREVWAFQEDFELLDLENGFFLSRFRNKADYQERPWTVQGHYITINKWRPEFRPTNADIKATLVWVRLPGLLVKYYGEAFLLRTGNALEKAIKVDYQTISTTRGKYAWLCVEVDLKQALVPFVYVDRELQVVEYERLEAICFECSRYGHVAINCHRKKKDSGETSEEKRREREKKEQEAESKPYEQ
ncbi:uncharacterized protein [Coffea arabica]|uniref:CCHC-type domain-containing protein n=1 Tax=Coffea arabica TaxID=13443 RepID=A0ABM4VMM0_COFAR